MYWCSELIQLHSFIRSSSRVVVVVYVYLLTSHFLFMGHAATSVVHAVVCQTPPNDALIRATISSNHTLSLIIPTIILRLTTHPLPLPLPPSPPSPHSTAPTTQSKHKMQRSTPLKPVLKRRLIVRHLLAAEDEPLLHRRDAFFFFDPLFDA